MDVYADPIPVVNETNIRNYVNKYVIVHGKVLSLKDKTLYLNMNPNQRKIYFNLAGKNDISVKNFSKSIKNDSTVKVIGKLYQDLSLEYYDHFELSDGFDLGLVNSAIPIIYNKEVCSAFI
jgi:hypothetical protein